MNHAMNNMSGLAACSVADSKPMQFPLAQRRKRRVLFTQAQVSLYMCYLRIFHLMMEKILNKIIPNVNERFWMEFRANFEFGVTEIYTAHGRAYVYLYLRCLNILKIIFSLNKKININ